MLQGLLAAAVGPVLGRNHPTMLNCSHALAVLLALCCGHAAPSPRRLGTTYDHEGGRHESHNTAIGTGCARVNEARFADSKLMAESVWDSGFYLDFFVDRWAKGLQITIVVGEMFDSIHCDQTIDVLEADGLSSPFQVKVALGAGNSDRFGCSFHGIAVERSKHSSTPAPRSLVPSIHCGPSQVLAGVPHARLSNEEGARPHALQGHANYLRVGGTASSPSAASAAAAGRD